MFVLEIILWLIFVGSAIMLSVVILLQEAKGGGLAEAFGGMGAQTFGVKASGINKFTSYVAVVFLLSAVLITCMKKSESVVEFSSTGTAPDAAQQDSVDPGTTSGGDPGAGSGDGSSEGN
ncbi:MAG: preprotein translocase subunit SecG [Planctomycetota bacterium]